MSLIDAFSLLGDADMQVPGGLWVTRTSYSGTQDDLGDFARDPDVLLLVHPAMVHPVSDGRALDQLPEADRQRDAVRVYTRTRLYCDATLQDFFEWRGRTWKVGASEDYSVQGDGFVSLATLMEATQ